MKVFFTSDQHFGHANIIRLCKRPFADVDEMNRVMLERWNAKVGERNRVYMLGDLFFRAADPLPILQQLKGRITLVLGNHDQSWVKDFDLGRYFESVHTMVEVSECGHPMTLCHCPMMTWNHCMRAYMIHGHIHANTNTDHWPLIRSNARMLNASVEVNGYEPVTFDELVANNVRFKAEH